VFRFGDSFFPMQTGGRVTAGPFNLEPNVKELMEPNQAALAIVDGAFSTLERRIGNLDQLTDRLQTSRERLADLDKEISQVKSDVDGLERSKRISRLTSLNSAKELALADDSAIVTKIVTTKARILEAVRNLISEVYWQLMAARKMNATLLLETHFEIRKIPIRLSDLANAARGVVELRNVEEILTRPQRGQAEELSALYALKARFEPIRAGVLAEENLVLELRTAEEPAVAEPVAELEPVAA
jgi:hypothetical protein